MKKLLMILLALMLVIGFAACTDDAETVSDTAEVEVEAPETEETDEEEADEEAEEAEENETEANAAADGLFARDNWSMEIAEGWEFMEMGDFEFLLAPGQDGSNINVITEAMQGFTAEAYVQENMNMLIEMFDEFELLREESFESETGEDVMLIVYSANFAGVRATYQFFIMVDGMAHIITYTRMGDADYFDAVLEMVNTFQVAR